MQFCVCTAASHNSGDDQNLPDADRAVSEYHHHHHYHHHHYRHDQEPEQQTVSADAAAGDVIDDDHEYIFPTDHTAVQSTPTDPVSGVSVSSLYHVCFCLLCIVSTGMGDRSRVYHLGI